MARTICMLALTEFVGSWNSNEKHAVAWLRHRTLDVWLSGRLETAGTTDEQALMPPTQTVSTNAATATKPSEPQKNRRQPTLH